MTKLTRNQHLEMAACLRDAKKLLNVSNTDFSKTIYVCIAIHRTNSSTHSYLTKQLCLDWIESQLGYDGGLAETFFGWLSSNHPELAYKIDRQVYRHAWVDHMINILES